MRPGTISLATLLLAFAACATREPPAVQTQPVVSPPDTNQLAVTSSAFKDGDAIPRQYTCDGVNISPPLEWGKLPPTTKTVAIIVDDPDAPAGTWVHWVVYNLPADNIGLVENLPPDENLKAGGFQGRNDFGNIGYGGPCPPSGMHRYVFKVYAVDAELSLKSGASKAEVEKALAGHVVAQAQLMGTYGK